jgi:type II secretory pathway component GspD/PulD (secretin)
MARHGDTLFIGGLIQNYKTKEKNAVPVKRNICGLLILYGKLAV